MFGVGARQARRQVFAALTSCSLRIHEATLGAGAIEQSLDREHKMAHAIQYEVHVCHCRSPTRRIWRRLGSGDLVWGGHRETLLLEKYYKEIARGGVGRNRQ